MSSTATDADLAACQRALKRSIDIHRVLRRSKLRNIDCGLGVVPVDDGCSRKQWAKRMELFREHCAHLFRLRMSVDVPCDPVEDEMRITQLALKRNIVLQRILRSYSLHYSDVSPGFMPVDDACGKRPWEKRMAVFRRYCRSLVQARQFREFVHSFHFPLVRQIPVSLELQLSDLHEWLRRKAQQDRNAHVQCMRKLAAVRFPLPSRKGFRRVLAQAKLYSLYSD